LFLAQFKQKQRAAANVLDTTHTLRLFLGVVGDKPLSAVLPEDMDAFLAAIADWPVNASKKPEYKDLNVQGVLNVSRRLHPPTLSLRTQEKHLDRLHVFFNWCVKRRDIPDNPASSLHVMTRAQEDERSRRAFLPSELQAFFDPANRDKHCLTPSRWWIPLLALHSGARVNELAQLNTADVEEVDHVWGFHIATRFAGQRLKNPKTKRFVPLHPALLDAGFLAYVADITQAQRGASGPLFPGLGKVGGDKVGDWFNRTYMPACGS
jgi:integrase